jgi:uncharacterized membrane protein
VAHAAPSSRPTSLLTAITIAIGAAIITGLVILWPSDIDLPKETELLRRGDLVEATTIAIERVACGGTVTPSGDPVPLAPGGPTCRRISFMVEEGDDQGTKAVIELPDTSTAPDLQFGERVVLEKPVQEIPGAPYAFYDRIRNPQLLWLASIFSVLVVVLGGLRGFAALIGLAISIATLLVFVLPAILDGSSPVLVASVGAGAIAFIVIYVAHGFTDRTTVALLGTLAGVAVTLGLTIVWTPLAHLVGLGSEGAYIIAAVGVEIDLAGLLTAGIVIGALGAIDDIAVTQASTVWELHNANPDLGSARLFRAGMRVGRDHVGSIVNTLALAYAGASLPLLILFELSESSLGRLISTEVVATEIVRTLVGSIGLVAAMPATTWLAAWATGHQGHGFQPSVE